MAKRTVLVTGGGGGLGRAVSDGVLESGWRVVVPELAGDRARTTARTGVVARDRRPHRRGVGRRGRRGGRGRAGRAAAGGGEPGRRVRRRRTRARDAVDRGRADARRSTCARPTSSPRPPCRTSWTPAAAPWSACRPGRRWRRSRARPATRRRRRRCWRSPRRSRSNTREGACAATRSCRASSTRPRTAAAQPDADYAKWVPPEEIAPVIRFLAGDESAPTSGAAIPVYGRA